MNLSVFAIAILASIGLFFIYKNIHTRSWRLPEKPFPEQWRKILTEYVEYYRSLDKTDQHRFEYKVVEFLLNYRITPVDCYIDITDRLLVAASATIPIFSFPNWRYNNLNEVLIYPSSFNDGFQISGKDTNILGMVGTGFMEGKMILSKTALRNGFLYSSDKRNTAIHEFVHLIDKADGTTDGIPQLLLEKQYALPWFNLMTSEIDAITKGRSDVHPYGATNNAEFLSVASEYFFENPAMLSTKHPELYSVMEEIFNQDLKNQKKVLKTVIHRNDPCPCNSGKKYKKCCGKNL
ncbi:zinc-dependent peptidase [Saccharicrinis sp. FJH62]|uniref:M90 family metallopeptidase n=1 Tax=Saccharicrinis sp. FJH62 TaxID=3344657 RepID=UPI0035D3E354